MLREENGSERQFFVTFISVTSKQTVITYTNIVVTVNNKTSIRPYYELLSILNINRSVFPNSFIISSDESCLCPRAPFFPHLDFGSY